MRELLGLWKSWSTLKKLLKTHFCVFLKNLIYVLILVDLVLHPRRSILLNLLGGFIWFFPLLNPILFLLASIHRSASLSFIASLLLFDVTQEHTIPRPKAISNILLILVFFYFTIFIFKFHFINSTDAHPCFFLFQRFLFLNFTL